MSCQVKIIKLNKSSRCSSNEMFLLYEINTYLSCCWDVWFPLNFQGFEEQCSELDLLLRPETLNLLDISNTSAFRPVLLDYFGWWWKWRYTYRSQKLRFIRIAKYLKNYRERNEQQILEWVQPVFYRNNPNNNGSDYFLNDHSAHFHIFLLIRVNT